MENLSVDNKNTDEQKELTEKLKILDKNIKILWKETGVASLIDGLITIPITKDVDDAVRHFLMEYSPLFGIKKDLSDLKFITKTHGIDSIHVTYQQFYQGIPVLNALISVHLNSEYKIIMVKNNNHPSIELDNTTAMINGGLSKENAIQIAHDHLTAETRLKKESTEMITIVSLEDQFYLTREVTVSLKNPPETYRVFIDIRNGDIIRKMSSFRRKTTGKGKVFVPNPVVALENINLTTESEIPEDTYITVILKGLDGSGFLRGEYVDTVNTPSRAYEPTHLFFYKRGDSKFYEVMAYYHIDMCQRFIQELGFKNICERPIKVNAFAEGTGSYFDYDNFEISFGGNNPPDAEDADIIIHEYGHAIIAEQVPGVGLTDEGCAIEQGFGDFLACVLFAEEHGGFNREAMGDWNGIGTVIHAIRRVDNQKYYPEDFLGILKCDSDGEIWSAALWDLYLTLGGSSKESDNRIKARERSLKIIIQSHFFLTPLSKFVDGAEAIISANKHMYNGKDNEKIRDVLIKRGFF